LKKSRSLFAVLLVITSLLSCKKEKDDGVPTILKGHVYDSIRGIDISGYKIIFQKKVGQTCANWECLTDFEDVATVYTDENGEYSISFNYKLNAGQEYCFLEAYYGIPYYHQSSSGSGTLIPGTTNTYNMFAWKPVTLRANIQVLNNNNGPLNMVCRFNGDKYLDAPEYIYEKDTIKTFSLRTRPNSDVNIDFWYYTGTNSALFRHDKIVSVHSTLNDITPLDIMVDCSTF
jgi:hypothetical protein